MPRFIRRPSIRKRLSARTSVKRAVRHRLGIKAPRGWGWLTNPRRAAYNRLYRRTTIGCLTLVLALLLLLGTVLLHLARQMDESEVEFAEGTTPGGELRHPSSKGLRWDNVTEEVVRGDA